MQAELSKYMYNRELLILHLHILSPLTFMGNLKQVSSKRISHQEIFIYFTLLILDARIKYSMF